VVLMSVVLKSVLAVLMLLLSGTPTRQTSQGSTQRVIRIKPLCSDPGCSSNPEPRFRPSGGKQETDILMISGLPVIRPVLRLDAHKSAAAGESK